MIYSVLLFSSFSFDLYRHSAGLFLLGTEARGREGYLPQLLTLFRYLDTRFLSCGMLLYSLAPLRMYTLSGQIPHILMSERDTKFIGDRKYCGNSVPVRVSFVRGQLFLVQGAANIVSLWKYPQVSTATAVHNFYLKQIFGMSEKALKLYTADNSGCFNDPHPLSNVEPRNRIDHITHQALDRLPSGPVLSPFFNRFTENLITRLLRLDIGGEWIDVEDLWGFLQIRSHSRSN